jgi:hypothetical protein
MLEGPYWQDAMEHLQQRLGNEFPRYRFLFYMLKTGTQPDVAEFSDINTVLIVLSDNSGEHFNEHFTGFKAVFKVHLSGGSGNVHPIPLGYTRMQLYGSEARLSERKTNVFYSGNLNANRVDFFRSLYTGGLPPLANFKNRQIRRGMLHAIRKLKLRRNFDTTFPDSHIRFTEAFASGLEPAAYTAKLADTKIAISPRGFWRPECFRDHEAMRAGCVIISDPLFSTWYFKDSPIIQLDRWSSLKRVVNNLLASPQELQKRQMATLDWWERKCSPRAVAHYIASKLNSNLTIINTNE